MHQIGPLAFLGLACRRLLYFTVPRMQAEAIDGVKQCGNDEEAAAVYLVERRENCMWGGWLGASQYGWKALHGEAACPIITTTQGYIYMLCYPTSQCF